MCVLPERQKTKLWESLRPVLMARAVAISGSAAAYLAGSSATSELGSGHRWTTSSNTGYPEGCALSCVAMAVVDLSFHLYMKIYNPDVKPLSFVDNLELVDTSMASLSASILSLQAWSDMWHLELDEKKSYTWSTTHVFQ